MRVRVTVVTEFDIDGTIGQYDGEEMSKHLQIGDKKVFPMDIAFATEDPSHKGLFYDLDWEEFNDMVINFQHTTVCDIVQIPDVIEPEDEEL